MIYLKFLKIFLLSILSFFVAFLDSKAYKTQLDYNYQAKDFQNFNQLFGSVTGDSALFEKVSKLLDKDGNIHLYSLCKFHYEKSCLCGISDKNIYSLDPLDSENCFCFNYPRYTSGNYASLYVDYSGDISVFVNTHANNSKMESDQVTGSYNYAGIELFDSKNSYTDSLKKLAERFDMDAESIKPADESQIIDFAEYGYCPSSMVVNPGHDNNNSMNHEGYMVFGKYGMGVSSSSPEDVQTASSFILFKKHVLGALTDDDIRIAMYSDFNDVFNLDTQGTNAFSKQDKEYIDNVIYDLNNSINYGDEDLAFCDFSKDGNNTYENISKALDFAIYANDAFVNESFKTHLFLEKLLENNDYNKLAEAVSENLGTDSKCYEKFGSYENAIKFEALYDKANKYMKNTKVDPGKNTITECKALLGDPSDPEYPAYYLQKALNFIKILGPVLIIVLSVYDYVKAIPSGDKEILSKVNRKSAIRISAGIALFFAPILVKALFTLLGLYNGSDCHIG